MKLWNSFIKELILASRSFYFYIEVGMAVVLLLILLFVVPENMESKTVEYLYYDMPETIKEELINEVLKDDIDGKSESVEIKYDNKTINADYYETEANKVYIVSSAEDVIGLADEKREFGAIVSLKDNKLKFDYYMQGYESERLKNIYLVFHNKDMDTLKAHYDQQEVVTMSSNYLELSDRENVIPAFLTLNGSLMGLFIIAAYIFLDKQEGMIKAYAVTASSVWQYLMSKVGVIITTSLISSLIIVVPIMGSQPDYLLLFVFLITTGLFGSALGLLVASFYNNIMQAFGSIYAIMIAMMLPSFGYFIPSWDPSWLRYIPSYPMIQGFKEIILKNGDTQYVLVTSLYFFIGGLVLFIIANYRYKKTLTV